MENKDEWIKRVVVDLYEYFYAASTNNVSMRFIPTDKQLKMVDNFLKLIKKKGKYHSIGSEYLVQYFTFQFNRWHDIDSDKFGRGKVMLNWVIGPKAWKLWLGRNTDYDFTIYNHSFLKKKRIVRSELLDICQRRSHRSNIPSIVEERERVKYLNKDIGLAWCMRETSLYIKSSPSCMKCRHKSDCKEILSLEYPKLYKDRE